MIIQDENIAIIVYVKRKTEIKDILIDITKNREKSDLFIGDFRMLLETYRNSENVSHLDNLKRESMQTPRKSPDLSRQKDWPSTIYGKCDITDDSCPMSLIAGSKTKVSIDTQAENSRILAHSLHSQIKVEDQRLDKIIFNDQRNREKKKLHYLMLGRIRQFMMDKTSELLQEKFLTKQLFTIFPDKRMHWERIDKYFEGAGPTDWQELEFRRVFVMALKDLAENVQEWQPIIKKKKFTLIDMAYLRSYVRKIQGLMQTHGV